MATLTKGALPMSSPTTFPDTHNVTFSQASEAGLTDSGWLAGPTTDLCGRAVALANHSVPPDKARERLTSVTRGPLFGGSSPSAGLQSSLANRLRAAMDVNGSPEFALIASLWDMRWGPPIYRLRASARRTSGNGFGGWPTPQAFDAAKAHMNHETMDHSRRHRRGGCSNLAELAAAGWATPTTRDWKDSPGMALEATNPDGTLRLRNDRLTLQARGQAANGDRARTGSSGAWNPALSRWLMGYPPAWCDCAAMETR